LKDSDLRGETWTTVDRKKVVDADNEYIEPEAVDYTPRCNAYASWSLMGQVNGRTTFHC